MQVEDLFYNVISRQKAFKSPSEEYAKILDVVGRYAIHCSGVAFSCKKHGDSTMGISTPSNASTVDSIRQIHGSAIANELIEFSVSDNKWGFKASGWTTNVNYHVKKTMLLLFINHRSVESSAIKKAVEQTYSTFLPKGGRPFVYLSLDIDPQRVDVNVHPTKREVNFLNEEEIVESICDEIRTKLSHVDTSRTFMTQSLIPGAKTAGSNLPNTRFEGRKILQKTPSSTSTPMKPLENNLVRTDPNTRKITSMLPPSSTASLSISLSDPYIVSPRAQTHCRLSTVKELRAAVRDAMHASLTEIFASHTYVGLVDPQRRIVAIQGGVKLFLVDYGMICNEYFYQLGLTDFGNFGAIRFEPALDIKELISIGVEIERVNDPVEGLEWNEVADLVTKHLVARREMLLEYFSIEVTPEGNLVSIPLLLKDYTPSLAKLPRFLMRLGPCVEWNDEKNCFRSFLTELAAFYTPEQITAPEQGNEDTDIGVKSTADVRNQKRIQELERTMEHVLFPAFKARLIATKGLLKGVVEVANLKGLYKVFERC